MKSNTIPAIILLILSFSVNAQQDTMYVMKNGEVVKKYNVETEIDSITFHNPEAQEPENTFTDPRDGTVYKTVTIGDQVWMAENLKYLPDVVGPKTRSYTEPYHYVYDYDGESIEDAKAMAIYYTYGVLYNWPAAMNEAESSTDNPSGVQGACPAGWHVPSNDEWMELSDYLGGSLVAGSPLKETGDIRWRSPNADATNETGFTARPGGYLATTNSGEFNNLGRSGYWWSATQGTDVDAFRMSMIYSRSNLYFGGKYKIMAASVRCVKD